MLDDFDDREPSGRRRVISGIRRRLSIAARQWENLGRIFGVVLRSWVISVHASGLSLDRGYTGSQINSIRAVIQFLGATLAKLVIAAQIRYRPAMVSVERLLKAYELVIVDRFTGDLLLSPSARRDWWAAVLDLTGGSDPALLSEMAGDQATTAQLQVAGNHYIALDGDELLGSWPSRSAVVADAAADRVFRDRLPYWEHLSIEHRSRILTGFRLFVEECPTCEDEISVNVRPERGTTGDQPIVGTCQGCNDRLFEFFVTDMQGVNR